ncbi:hypothetical protein PHMEG_00033184 [Phytophthora megakarya]|uniref:Uncharacterized protein n=1 Tax=Phytophthora megakarya TaxID=4795 RepID=A0A225UVC9_9STRA|nr:hypothetical protein PHMEG_00033184 [Phytophthora megakarya]
MELDAAQALIDEDKTGNVLRIMLDKYAYSLARAEGKILSTNTCLAYYENVKNWLVDKYPLQSSLVKPQLHKILTARDERPAAAKRVCSKQDLEEIVRLLYTSASNDTNYTDTATVVMYMVVALTLNMWRKNSYLSCQVCKMGCYIFVKLTNALFFVGRVLFICFKRVKTAVLQGISLFKDPTNGFTCPLFCLAAKLV